MLLSFKDSIAFHLPFSSSQSMDMAQWPKGIGVVKSMEDARPAVERKARPQKDQALKCPRCNSTNTKFCYYNNYSLTQPRYFCKTCRRYWTEGGSLRNVPVGGGSRKNKRSSSSSTTVTTSTSSPLSGNKVVTDLNPPGNFLQSASQNPKIHQGQDLNLTYPPTDDYSSESKFVGVPLRNSERKNPSSSTNASSNLSAMELLKSGIASRGLISFLPIPESDSNMFVDGCFPMHDFKPAFNFSLDGFENGYGGFQNVQETVAGTATARHLFPMEDVKQVPSNASTEFQQTRELGDPAGYWNGVFGGGSW